MTYLDFLETIPTVAELEGEHCGWLIQVGYCEDGEPIIRECGGGPLHPSDGLCSAHTRGMSLEDYLAPFGPAWQEEYAR